MTIDESIQRTPSGLELLDEMTGGLPFGELCLVCGGADSGKTILSLQFALAGLKREEHVAWVSSIPPEELLARAETHGFAVGDYLGTNQFILLQQKTQAAAIIRNEQELEDMIAALEDEIVAWEPSRIVFDSAIPFIDLLHPEYRKAGFAVIVRALHRLGATVLWTTRMPASGEAMALRKNIEDLAGSSLHLDEHRRPDGEATRRLVVRKFHGVRPPFPVFHFEIEDGKGLMLSLREDVALDSPRDVAKGSARGSMEGQPSKADSLLFTKHGASAKKIESLDKKPAGSIMSSALKHKLAPPAPQEKTPGPRKGFSFSRPSEETPEKGN